jgi:hypothetical protein
VFATSRNIVLPSKIGHVELTRSRAPVDEHRALKDGMFHSHSSTSYSKRLLVIPVPPFPVTRGPSWFRIRAKHEDPYGNVVF